MMRITLLRHGKPAFALKGVVRARHLGAMASAYDASGIVGMVPVDAVAAARGNPVVVCSDLVRSIDSAKALGCSEVHVIDPLFRETALPYFGSGSLRLPVSVWVVVLRLLWLFGFAKNGESLKRARQRARAAAERLVALAEERQNVLLVGHGFINHFIAKELLKAGWLGPSRPGREFWSYGIYERANT